MKRKRRFIKLNAMIEAWLLAAVRHLAQELKHDLLELLQLIRSRDALLQSLHPLLAMLNAYRLLPQPKKRGKRQP